MWCFPSTTNLQHHHASFLQRGKANLEDLLRNIMMRCQAIGVREEQVVLLVILHLFTSAFFNFVGNLSLYHVHCCVRRRILNHRQPIFLYHYFPSFIGRLKSKHHQSERAREYHTVSRARTETRFFKCFFGCSSKASISRRHKLIRSWLQPTWTLTSLALQSTAIVSKRRSVEEKHQKKNGEKTRFRLLFKSINRQDGPHLSLTLCPSSCVYNLTIVMWLDWISKLEMTKILRWYRSEFFLVCLPQFSNFFCSISARKRTSTINGWTNEFIIFAQMSLELSSHTWWLNDVAKCSFLSAFCRTKSETHVTHFHCTVDWKNAIAQQMQDWTNEQITFGSRTSFFLLSRLSVGSQAPSNQVHSEPSSKLATCELIYELIEKKENSLLIPFRYVIRQMCVQCVSGSTEGSVGDKNYLNCIVKSFIRNYSWDQLSMNKNKTLTVYATMRLRLLRADAFATCKVRESKPLS
jgi:hypothetical protein